jgi:hypothetical protein
MAEAFSVLQARCDPVLYAQAERAAKVRGVSQAEFIRHGVRTALQADGFDPAAVTARDAGALYDVVAGLRHWALVAYGNPPQIRITHRSAEKPDLDDASHYPVDYLPIEGDRWLPIEYQDSEPFHDDRHWRLPYETTIEPERVLRTYPVIVKSLEAM